MNKTILAVAAAFVLAACTGGSSSNAPADGEFERQSQKYWEQTQLVDKQQAETAAQIERSERLLKRNEEILDRWDKIQERHERVLSAMEKQYKVQQ